MVGRGLRRRVTVERFGDPVSDSKVDPLSEQAYALGVLAYIWGYPMVVMQKSRDAMTKGGDAPVTPE
jgi:hypothetical protein